MSEYEDVIKLIDAEHETYVGTATIYIPRLRKALEKENKSKEEIKDRILNDCEKYWERRTIMDALGEDFKDVKKREAGTQKGKIKEEILQITNDGRTETEPPNKVSPATFADESINTSSTIPSPVESATERAKRLMQETGYDIDEEKEDIQIKINDLQTQLENERSERIRISQLLDKEREKNKDPNFTPASELVKPAINPDDDTSPVLRSVYKKTIGELNTRILELKDKLNEVQKYDEVIEIKNQKIALVIEATNLKSVTVDEAKSRRLN